MATTAYKKTALTGGGASALDGIDGSGLLDGDFSITTVSNVVYIHLLDADSGLTESSPDVISPDANAGTKRWILQSCRTVPATAAEAVAGTDTTKTITAAGNAASEAVIKNPLAFSQGINITYAASGSNGIQIADSAHLDMGTQNFTLAWRGSFPDYTPSSMVYMFYRIGTGDTRIYFNVRDTGTLSVYIGDATAYISTAAANMVDGTEHLLVAVVTRETASVNGSVLFYVDGLQLGDAVTISARSPLDLSTTADMYIAGTNSIRYASNNRSAIMFNKALTAAQVLNLYRHGIETGDKWGSQTVLYTSDFSAGVDSWAGGTDCTVTGNQDGINGSDNWLKCTRDAGAGSGYCYCARNTTLPSMKYANILLTIYNPVGSGISHFSVCNSGSTNSVAVIAVAEGVEWTGMLTLSGTGSGGYYLDVGASTPTGSNFATIAAGKYFYMKAISAWEAGAVLAMEPEGVQPAPGQWLDSSSNKLHGWQPAAGSSILRYKNTFEIRGRNTWAGTHEAQSIAWPTDASRAILPAGCYIDEIIGVVTGATPQDIIIGDGSDNDRWVTITTGLATGTVSFTPANRISDGTNYEMVVDPDTNTTMTITWTIRGHILD